MQYHTEFRCDPPQDRACLRRVMQEWLELEARRGAPWDSVQLVARPGEGRVPTDSHVLDAVGSQVTRYRIRCIVRPKNSEFLH